MTAPLWVVAGALLAAGATRGFLTLARTRGWGKVVRRDGPEGHLVKEGTPTLGGVAFLPVALALGVLATLGLGPDRPGGDLATAAALLGLVAASAALGAWDDLGALARKARPGEDAATGVLARWRLLAQTGVGLAFGAWAVQQGHTMVGVPAADVAGFAFVVVGSVNALNFTDGLDGLAAGVTAVVLLAFLHDPFAAALLGALLGFLWFNAHPARLFMGGVGSEALGAALAGLAIVHGDVWRLPLLAAVPVAEVLSVVVQVAAVRLTGRRVLRMSPLHHHFELLGWEEPKVVTRFVLVTAVAVALAVATRGTA
ncbi:MAG: hypothetical protein RI554_02465 [Trueperaceae bacterium]|nr:hypothetical protein [Trueperaceae bacterium]